MRGQDSQRQTAVCTWCVGRLHLASPAVLLTSSRYVRTVCVCNIVWGGHSACVCAQNTHTHTGMGNCWGTSRSYCTTLWEQARHVCGFVHRNHVKLPRGSKVLCSNMNLWLTETKFPRHVGFGIFCVWQWKGRQKNSLMQQRSPCWAWTGDVATMLPCAVSTRLPGHSEYISIYSTCVVAHSCVRGSIKDNWWSKRPQRVSINS